MLNNEILKGTVIPISIQNLMLNIMSINLSLFLVLPAFKETFHFGTDEMLEDFLNERCKSNVQFILNALKP
jgi:hypothetical protein